MTNFPTTRQLPSTAPPQADAHGACADALTQAFSTFNHAAESLESTYIALRDEVQQLRRELAGTNQQLSLSLADRKSTRLNSSHIPLSRMPSSA